MAYDQVARGFVQRPFALLFIILVAGFTASLAEEAAKSTPEAPADVRLALRMNPTTPVIIMLDRVRVEWQLENTGQKSVYVCQWPGIAFSQHWECPKGVLVGTAPGYPHSRRLDRKYFLELKPDEAIVGYGHVDVWPTPSGVLSLSAEFTCDQDGREYGLMAWKGRIGSEWVSIDVPKDAKAKACEQK